MLCRLAAIGAHQGRDWLNNTTFLLHYQRVLLLSVLQLMLNPFELVVIFELANLGCVIGNLDLNIRNVGWGLANLAEPLFEVGGILKYTRR